MSNDLRPIHDSDAEVALIGSLLINHDCLYDVLDITKPSDCYQKINIDVFQAIISLDERGDPLDAVTVANELKTSSHGDVMTYLTDLMTKTPNSYHATKYAQIVADTATRRRLTRAGSAISTMAYDMDTTAEDVLSVAESTVFGVRKNEISNVSMPQDYIMNYLHHLDRMQNHDGSLVGAATGLNDLDRMLDGLQRPYQYILAGRPGMGKSALAGCIALNMIQRGKRVLFFALEMSQRQIVDRFISRMTRTPLSTIKKPWLLNGETQAVQRAAGRLSEMKLFIDDSPGLTPAQIRAKSMRVHAQHGLDLIIIDHLHLVRPDRRLNRTDQEITEITRSFMNLGKSLNVPILTAAQLSRGVESRSDKRPVLSDLRESGGIEENAYAVMFLYRDDYYNEMSDRPNEADIIIAKNRDGATGVIPVHWNPNLTSFENLAKYPS